MIPSPFLRMLLTAVLVALAAAADDDAPAGGAPAAAAADERPKQSVWAAQYDYGTATAAEPNFQNRKLWPHLTGKEYFLASTFPKVRTLIWAKPGESGEGGKLNPLDPANWTDAATGKPAAALPDKDTDVVLPAAKTPYVINFQEPGHGGKEMPLTARHITVGANAEMRCPDAMVYGNVWVQRGGCCYVDVYLRIRGPFHTFYRNDNHRHQTGKEADLTYFCQYLNFNKDAIDISMELLGTAYSGDEFQVDTGTLIIGTDSVIEMGRDASPYVAKQGRIALMDNAFLSKWQIELHQVDLELRGGALQAGMPDRPISRSPTFKLSWKNYTNAVYTGPGEKPRHTARTVGLVVGSGSQLRSYTADPAKARLIIGALPLSYSITFLKYMPPNPKHERDRRNPNMVAMWKWLDELPKGVDVAIAKDAIVDGVEFDGLRKGGLMAEDPATARSWKNVFYGTKNLAKPDEILAAFPGGKVKIGY